MSVGILAVRVMPDLWRDIEKDLALLVVLLLMSFQTTVTSYFNRQLVPLHFLLSKVGLLLLITCSS